jgi:hypothetical protein
MTDIDLVRAGRTLAGMDAIEEETEHEKPRRWDFSWNRWSNRVIYSLIAGTVINVATGINALGAVVTVVLFVLTSVIVEVGRRR